MVDPEGEGLVFPLHGVISTQTQVQFNALQAFATGHPQLEIDLSRVTRIDFTAIGLLLETLMQLQAKGCQLQLKEGSELVTVLLHIVGINQFATVLPRIRK